MKTCKYHYMDGLYHTECGSKLLFRPSVKCDKCGKKPQEKR